MGDEDEKHASSKAILTDPEEYCPGTWTETQMSGCLQSFELGGSSAAHSALSTQQHFALSAQHSAISSPPSQPTNVAI